MFSKARQASLAGALLCFTAIPAAAQIESFGLDDVDAWGTSLLERGEPAFSDRVWSGSDTDYLISLLAHIDVDALTQPERTLLSRAVRSPALAPEGENVADLFAARLDLLTALGEDLAAAKFARQGEDVPEDFDGDAILSDKRLADGETDVVCLQMDPGAEGAFWAQLRAMCALNAGDMAAAELSVEIAAMQPETSEWYSETAIALLGDLPDRPSARYGSGMELALSEVAELEPDAESLAGADPKLAAELAMDKDLPIEFRVAAATLAAESGVFPASRHREIYDELISADEFEPSNAIEAALIILAVEPEPEPEPELPVIAATGPRDLRSMNEDWIEPVPVEEFAADAGEAEEIDEVSLEEQQGLALAEALRQTATSPERFAATARLFEPDLSTLKVNEDTLPGALVFATASLMGGNEKGAMRWLNGIDEDELSEAEAFDSALLKGYALIFANQKPYALIEDITGTLMETAIEPDQQDHVMRLFSLWSGFEMPVPVKARAALAGGTVRARRVESGALAAIDAAARNGAPGEALFAILGQTNGQPELLSGADLADISRLLRRFGAEGEAGRLALQASQIWMFAAD